jgi:hypothetical protein
LSVQGKKSNLRWRTPLQAMGYVRATARNSVKGDNNPKQFSLSRSLQPKNGTEKLYNHQQLQEKFSIPAAS